MSDTSIPSNFWTGLGHGALSLIGFGDKLDPLGDLKKELSKANSTMQHIINSGTYNTLQQQGQFNTMLKKYIDGQSADNLETMNYYNALATNTTQEQNYFIACTLILVFILIFFMLIRKN